MKQAGVIGLDIGGTKIAAHISDGTLWSVGEVTRPTPPESKPEALHQATDKAQAKQAGREALLNTIIAVCRDLLAEAEKQQISIHAIGIGTAGQVDPDKGIVVDANENLVGWKGTPIAETVGQALGLPVVVDNDVRVMALAECTLGAGKDFQHVLCLTVGTGIGGAIVLNGKLWHGAHFGAGEIGYIKVDAEHSIEEVTSGPALERLYQEATDAIEPVSLREIVQRAQQGDAIARNVIVQAGAERLGTFLAPVLAFLDPEAVVVGGGISEIGNLWWQPFIAALRRFKLLSVQHMPILKAQLGNRAGMIGAAILAMQHVQNANKAP